MIDRIKPLLFLVRQVCTSVNLANTDFSTISSHSYINLCYAGQSFSWTENDIKFNCHELFLKAKLYHLYPIWQICKGLLRIVISLGREAKLCRRICPDISLHVFKICIEINKMLLWSELDFRYPGKFEEILAQRRQKVKAMTTGSSEHWISASLG